MRLYINKIFEKLLLKKDPIGYSRSIGVKVGENCRFLGISRATFGSEPFLIKIGNHVTLTANVRFITHDGGVWVFREKYPDIDVFGDIAIGNNVFIGLNSIIMPNTRVGNNVVIGAGSLVKGIVESDSVYAGVPAKKIMSLKDYEEKVVKVSTNTKSLNREDKLNFLREKFK